MTVLPFRERPNRSYDTYALGLLTPIAPGCETALRSYLEGLGTGAASPLARLPSTHFARWVIIDQLNYEGPWRRHQQLARQYLLFTSAFDWSAEGSALRYLAGLAEGMPDAVEAIWGRCEGFPRGRPVDPKTVGRWLREHQLNGGYLFAAYASATLGEVRDSLAWQRRLEAFVVATQDASPAELQAAFRRRLQGAEHE